MRPATLFNVCLFFLAGAGLALLAQQSRPFSLFAGAVAVAVFLYSRRLAN